MSWVGQINHLQWMKPKCRFQTNSRQTRHLETKLVPPQSKFWRPAGPHEWARMGSQRGWSRVLWMDIFLNNKMAEFITNDLGLCNDQWHRASQWPMAYRVVDRTWKWLRLAEAWEPSRRSTKITWVLSRLLNGRLVTPRPPILEGKNKLYRFVSHSFFL